MSIETITLYGQIKYEIVAIHRHGGHCCWAVTLATLLLVLFLFYSISISISVDYHIKFYGNFIKRWCILCPSENERMPFMWKFFNLLMIDCMRIFSPWITTLMHLLTIQSNKLALNKTHPAQIHSTSCQFELFMIEQISNFNIVVVHFGRIIDSMPPQMDTLYG